MASFNQIVLLGNTTRDPQLKYLPNQTAVVEFGLAVNHKFKDREEVMYVDCACFGKGAEVISKYVQKGRPLLVSGRLKLDTWEKDGQKRFKHSVVVDNFQLMGDRGSNSGGGGGQGHGPAPSQQPPKPQENDRPSFEDSDIPFLWTGRMDQPI